MTERDRVLGADVAELNQLKSKITDISNLIIHSLLPYAIARQYPGEAEDIGGTAVWLASDDSESVNDSTLR